MSIDRDWQLEAAPAPDAARGKVLIVDDRPDNLLALEAVLEPLGAPLIRASSGAEALRALLLDEFAVILLDVQMPDLDGFETARHIKERDRTRNVPIIFLTAIDRGIEQQLRGYGVGAVDYLAKPFEPELLRSKVSVFLSLYDQSRLIAEQNRLLAERLAERDRAEAALNDQARELQRSNAELERFAFAVSHDLLEPLQITAGLLDLLAEQSAGELPEDSVMLLARARAGATQMGGLVEGLLRYAQTSALEMRREPVNLNEVLAEAEAELAGPLAESGALVTHDPLPVVTGDRWQLRQVFVHLLDNAVRYRQDRPTVHVGLAQRDGSWVISVRDDGVGIEPALLPRLFVLLGRPQGPGGQQGVGLAVCRRMVERHGGIIWAESVLGQGTAVSFTLPVDHLRPAAG